jgi:hypothetical protein
MRVFDGRSTRGGSGKFQGSGKVRMANVRLTRSAACGILAAGLGALAAPGCTGGSARTDYYASRSIVLPAETGDGSIIATAPEDPDAAWRSSLTFVPLSGEGDLADNR